MILCEAVVTVRDKGRLLEALDRARGTWTTFAPSQDSFRANLRRAEVVAPADVPEDVVTMNSRFDLLDLRTGNACRYTLVYPGDAQVGDRERLNVFSALGMAVLGARLGDVVRWNGTHGPGSSRIVRLVYQPEAAGHHHV